MNVHCVNLDLQLPSDKLVDLLLFQWHTPDPLEDHTFRKIASPYVEQKRAVLEQFRDWFLGRPDPRLAFVVLPEMSVPLSCAGVLADLVGRARSPMVVIGGFEPLTWTEYQTLAGTMSDTPKIEQVGEGSPDPLWVNAAGIWVRTDDGKVLQTDDGKVLRFVQSKRHPSDPELPQFHRGENVIVFRSSDQSALRRLNFCVQICSDLCSRRFVSELRAAIGQVSPGLHLDFLLLPQHNPDQEKDQFQESIKDFFDTSLLGVQTNEGCLVFVNNANENQGKSSAYGGSRVYFPWGIWRHPEVPPPTYWLKNYLTHQASIVRESGPGLYSFTYKPHYCADRRPGGGDVLPFARALLHAIQANRLEPVPVHLEAEAHWLRNEWVSGKNVFVDNIKGNSAEDAQAETKAKSCGDAYMECTRSWCDYFAVRPEIARYAIGRYFCQWADKKQFPDYPANEAEPNRWCRDVSRGVTRLMQTYCLLTLGTPDEPPGMRPDCDWRGWHAAIGDNTFAVFIWGNGERSARALILACRSMQLEVTLLSKKVLLVLVDPAGNADPCQLQDDLQVDSHSVSKVGDLEGLPKHLKPDGDVVEANSERHFSTVNNHMLLQEVYNASNDADLRSRLAGVLRAEPH
jgi:hypothetical protein